MIERRRGVRGREHPVDRRRDPALGEQRDDAPRERLHRRALLLHRPGTQHGAHQRRALAHQRAQRHVELRAGARADDDDPAPGRQRTKVAGQVRRTDQLEHDVRLAVHVLQRHRVGAHRRQPLAGGLAARVGQHPRARRQAELDGGRPDAPAGAVDQQRLARDQSGAGEHRVVRGDERLGNRGRLLVREPVGDARHVPLVHGDAVGQTTAADDPEHAVADLPAEHRSAGRDHRPTHLEPGYVGDRAGRRRVVAGALHQIRRVEPRMRRGDHDLVRLGHRIGPFLEPHHLGPARSREHDGAHRRSLPAHLGLRRAPVYSLSPCQGSTHAGKPGGAMDDIRRQRTELENHLIDELISGRLTRREFVRRGTVMGMSIPLLGAIVAACGGANSTGAARRPAAAARAPRPSSPAARCALRSSFPRERSTRSPWAIREDSACSARSANSSASPTRTR